MPRERLQGEAQLRVALTRVVRGLLDAAVEGIREGAEAVRRDARANAPHDTGQLAEGIDIEYTAGGLIADVAERDPQRTHIAEWREAGTSSIPAHPFMAPAAAAERPKLPGRVEAAIVKRLGKL